MIKSETALLLWTKSYQMDIGGITCVKMDLMKIWLGSNSRLLASICGLVSLCTLCSFQCCFPIAVHLHVMCLQLHAFYLMYVCMTWRCLRTPGLCLISSPGKLKSLPFPIYCVYICWYLGDELLHTIALTETNKVVLIELKSWGGGKSSAFCTSQTFRCWIDAENCVDFMLILYY